MQISKIYSTRNSNSEVYSDLIYEWEDDYSTHLNVPIYSFNKFRDRFVRAFYKFARILNLDDLIQKIDSIRSHKSLSLVFELYPRSFFSFQVFSNKIPFIIDFDYNVDLNTFYKVYKNCSLILISNLEAFNYLKANNCPLNIEHLPLSISDRYKIDVNSDNYKEFDVIVVRSNKIFIEYLERFSSENKDFEYVVRRWEGSKMYRNNVYYSNKRGILGEFSDRKSYLELLKKAKVALYATPGYDENRDRFMNHVTPSLFEFISSGCRIIARYPKNLETIFFNLGQISPNIDTYEKFEILLKVYINDSSIDYLQESEKFLDPIYTKNRIAKLQTILNK